MKAGELFVSLGLTGVDKVIKGLNATTNALADAAGKATEVSTSMMTLGAILGAAAGMERLVKHASKAGLDLMRFNVATGESVDTLQRWQLEAAKFGVQGDEVAGTISNIKNLMVKMRMGLGAPSTFGNIADAVNIDPKKVDNAFYMFNKLVEYAKKVPGAIAEEMLKPWGVSRDMLLMMKMTSGEINKIDSSAILNDDQAKKLGEIYGKWAQMWALLDALGKKFVVIFGDDFVTWISWITKGIISLSEKLDPLHKKISDFFGKIADIWVTNHTDQVIPRRPYSPDQEPLNLNRIINQNSSSVSPTINQTNNIFGIENPEQLKRELGGRQLQAAFSQMPALSVGGAR